MYYFTKKFFYLEAVVCVLTLIVGTLLHFLYQWSGQNVLVGLFAPVNESTWEHLKLLFFPVLFFSVFEYVCLGRFFPRFLLAKTLSVLAGMAFLVIFFYTYSGILGSNLLWMDILCFFLSVFLTYGLTWYLSTNTIFRKKGAETLRTNLLCLLFLLLITLCFFYFTDHPPGIGLFTVSVQFP